MVSHSTAETTFLGTVRLIILPLIIQTVSYEAEIELFLFFFFFYIQN